MSKRASRLGGALSALALLALVAAGLATAASPPPPARATTPGKVKLVGQTAPSTAVQPRAIHALGYRLTATLAPSSAASSASGRWDGVLVHTFGVVKNGAMPSVPGCSLSGPKAGGPGQAPPRASGLPHRIKCNGPVPPFAVPGSGQHWILGWVLRYSNLSSSVTGADLRVSVSGSAAPAVAASLCTSCVSGKFGRTLLTDDQAAALLNGNGSVVVRTVKNPSGELSGPIVRIAPTAAHG